MMSISCINDCPDGGVFVVDDHEMNPSNETSTLRITPFSNDELFSAMSIDNTLATDRLNAILHELFLLDSRHSSPFTKGWKWNIAHTSALPELLLTINKRQESLVLEHIHRIQKRIDLALRRAA